MAERHEAVGDLAQSASTVGLSFSSSTIGSAPWAMRRARLARDQHHIKDVVDVVETVLDRNTRHG
jgi:hypothetical protein